MPRAYAGKGGPISPESESLLRRYTDALLQRAVKQYANTATNRITNLPQPLLCDPQRLDVRDLSLEAAGGIPQIDVALQVQPELRRVPEELTEPQGHLRADGPPLAQEFVHGLPRDARSLGQGRDREVVFGQKILAEDLAWVNGAALQRAGVGHAHRIARASGSRRNRRRTHRRRRNGSRCATGHGRLRRAGHRDHP